MISIEGAFFKGSTLTYRTRDDHRGRLFFVVRPSEKAVCEAVRVGLPRGWETPVMQCALFQMFMYPRVPNLIAN